MLYRFLKALDKSKGNKGFSLVELLIVIAIMGVLAVIAFNAFSGVLTGSKEKADIAQAGNIQRAVTTLVTQSGITTLNGKFYTGSNVGLITITNPKQLIEAMQSPMWAKDSLGTFRSYGPFLQANTGLKTFDAFLPQWTPDTGGRNTGYDIKVDKSTSNVLVTLSTSGTAVDSNGGGSIGTVIN